MQRFTIMSFYDHYASHETTRAGKAIVERVSRRMHREIAATLPGTGCDILEIGPGDGDLARAFLDAGYRRYTAVEPNATIRTKLEAMGLTVHNYLIPELREPDASQDAIILSHVFEHLNGTPEARRFVEEAVRVLRPGGRLCILSPDFLHWGRDFFNGDYTHGHVTTIRRTVQLFEDAGLSVRRAKYFSGPFGGVAATALSLAMRILLGPVCGEDNQSRLYKLKTSFLRTFLVIGEKA